MTPEKVEHSDNEKARMLEVLLLAFGVMARFRCKSVAKKPDARSWSIEQDFIEGARTAFSLVGKELHPIIAECHKARRSITTLTANDFKTPNWRH